MGTGNSNNALWLMPLRTLSILGVSGTYIWICTTKYYYYYYYYC